VTAAVVATAMVLPAAARADENPEQLEVSIRADVVVESPTLSRWQEPTASITHRVNVADLDLSRREDVAELRNRIDETAEVVCRRLGELYPEASAAREMQERATCVTKAVEDAIRQVRYRVALAVAPDLG
jgi:UrcA family protein